MGEEYGLNVHAIAKNSPPLPRRASSRVTRWRKITRSFLILPLDSINSTKARNVVSPVRLTSA